MPISNSTKVAELPSRAVDCSELTPLIERSALSTRWVIWFSISVGDAPGWEMMTCTAGKSTSGLSVTSMKRKLTIPASSRPVKNTNGITGLRIDQAEMSRRAIMFLPWVSSFVCARGAVSRQIRVVRALERGGYFFSGLGLMLSPGLRKPPARSTTCSVPESPSVIAIPCLVTAPVVTPRRTALLSLLTT